VSLPHDEGICLACRPLGVRPLNVRLIWPARAIHEAHPDIEVVINEPRKDADTGLRVIMKGDAVIEAHCPEDADLLVFQRPTVPDVAAAIPFWRAKGVAVVVDLDDDLSHIDPANPAWVMMHPDRRSGRLWSYESDSTRQHIAEMVLTRLRAEGRDPDALSQSMLNRLALDLYVKFLGSFPRHSWLAAKEAAASATLTTVSTPALAGRYGRGNARVIENYVPARFLDTPHEDSDLVGWPGSTHSHPGDLAVMGGAVASLLRDGGRFLVVGDSTGADRELGVEVPMTGPIGYDGWIEAVAQLGVGVAPLAESRFNEAKSWLKPLELSAAGVPWVASPRPEYQRLAALGCGALAAKPKDWLRALRSLVRDPALRAEQSAAGREVAGRLTVEGNAWRTAEVWAEAVEIERAWRPQAVSGR